MLLGRLVLYSASLSFHREEGQNLNAGPPRRKDGTERNKRCIGSFTGNTEGSRTQGSSKVMGHACALLTNPEMPQAQSMVCVLHGNRLWPHCLHQGSAKALATSFYSLQQLA